MLIGIHNSNCAYSKRWIEFCKLKNISFKVVNAYSDSIIKDLEDCQVFLWHHSHTNYKDVNFGKQLLFALEQSGKIVFPDFNTGWHFDDKLGQKYLFEAHNIRAARSYVFYDKNEAINWVNQASFPKIFKLRGGAGSSNVKLVRDKKSAIRLINKAFGKGFKSMDFLNLAFDRYKLWKRGRSSLKSVLGCFFYSFFPKLHSSHLLPIQKGYVYFQEFIPNDGYDIRIEITGERALAMVRFTREGDFRASGSNNLVHNTDLIDKEVVEFAFSIADKLKLQSCALDIVRDNRDNKLYLIENSYCYGVDEDEFDYGYWTRDGICVKGDSFNGLDWIVECVLRKNHV